MRVGGATAPDRQRSESNWRSAPSLRARSRASRRLGSAPQSLASLRSRQAHQSPHPLCGWPARNQLAGRDLDLDHTTTLTFGLADRWKFPPTRSITSKEVLDWATALPPVFAYTRV